jgi:hypothetical protein
MRCTTRGLSNERDLKEANAPPTAGGPQRGTLPEWASSLPGDPSAAIAVQSLDKRGDAVHSAPTG